MNANGKLSTHTLLQSPNLPYTRSHPFILL
jgi:hypothetical protein